VLAEGGAQPREPAFEALPATFDQAVGVEQEGGAFRQLDASLGARVPADPMRPARSTGRSAPKPCPPARAVGRGAGRTPAAARRSPSVRTRRRRRRPCRRARPPRRRRRARPRPTRSRAPPRAPVSAGSGPASSGWSRSTTQLEPENGTASSASRCTALPGPSVALRRALAPASSARRTLACSASARARGGPPGSASSTTRCPSVRALVTRRIRVAGARAALPRGGASTAWPGSVTARLRTGRCGRGRRPRRRRLGRAGQGRSRRCARVAAATSAGVKRIGLVRPRDHGSAMSV
jgi:hypothetical protein